MSATNAILQALLKKGMKQMDLIGPYGKTPAALYNKFARDTWTAKDLILVGRAIGCKPAFVFPDGSQIYIEDDSPQG